MLPVDIVNNFFFFIIRLTANLHNWNDFNGDEHFDYLPDFLVNVDWNCDASHIITKWKGYDGNLQEKFVDLYTDLDKTNRERLVNYIMNTYND